MTHWIPTLPPSYANHIPNSNDCKFLHRDILRMAEISNVLIDYHNSYVVETDYVWAGT